MRRYRPKPKPQDVCLNSNNFYRSMIETDALYPQNLQNLSIPHFKIYIQKITRDINLLLHMNDNQFWKQLEENQSLRIALQSCLSVFTRRVYSGYEVSSLLKRETISENDQNYGNFKMYAHLTKAVLYIYYRISNASTQAQKDLVYSLWLLDIPKLLDLTAIYGESNPVIVGKIIQNTYSINPDYHYDTFDFFQLVENHKLLSFEVQKIFSIDFSPYSLKHKRYGNRQKFMLSQTMQQIFRFKDLLFNLTNFLIFFPQKYVNQLASDYKIQERLLKSLSLFLKQSSEDWKLGQYQKYFQFPLQDIRQSVAKYFLLEFKILRSILQHQQQKDLQQAAQNTYETLCLTFQFKKNEEQNKYFRRMINILIQHSNQQIFFLPVNKLRNPAKRIKMALQECINYETSYRKSNALAGNTPLLDETYQKCKQSLKKWRLMNTKPILEKTSNLQQAKMLQSKLSPQQPSYDYDQIQKLKYKFISPQYDDDFEEIDQFARFENQPIRKTQQNTDLSMFMFQKQPSTSNYQIGKVGTRDLELSVWSEKSFTQKAQVQLSFHQSQIQMNRIPQAQSRQPLIFKKILNQNEKSVELSFMNEQSQKRVKKIKLNEKQKDLSFSMNLSNINNQNNNLSIFQENHVEQNIEENDELISLLADINSLPQFIENNQKNQAQFSDNQDFGTFDWENSQCPFSLP